MRKIIRIITLLLCISFVLSTAACTDSSPEVLSHDTEAEDATEKSNTEGAKEEESILETYIETESQRDTDVDTGAVTELITGSKTDTDTETETEAEAEADTDTETYRISITEYENGAEVKTLDGLEYRASNYILADAKNGFKINQGFTVTFPEGAFAREFNRFTVEYKSSSPLKIFVTYSVDGEDRTDYYYLEAIKTSFKGLVDTYLDGKNSTELKQIVFNTCEENDSDFVLYDLSLDTQEFYPNDLSVENERFKVGVRLTWGGAMTYFEDKNDGIADLGNLVNIHDTGRLIQQSFYGTYTNDEYTSGNYSDSKWPYNPVQGGNKYQNGRTRLIDIEVGEDYIYVKAQSLDWALDSVLTHTYYENTYVLQEDNVLVDNRMVDYSGWKHVQGGQEIPAMYIVSYFGTLAYYNSTKSWTDDVEGLYYERELGGWGASVTVPLVEGNDETWAIWMNEDDNFCFGIYTPNIDRLVAIRHQYNGSKDPMSNSTSYVATSCVLTMQSYLPVEYQYLLATGSFDDVRAEFKENKDFTDNASLNNNREPFRVSSDKFDMTDLDFTVKGNEKVFNGPRIVKINYDENEKAARFCLTNLNDPYAYLDFYWNSDRELTAEDYNVFEIEYMIPESNSKNGYYMVLFLCAGEIKTAKDGYTASANLTADGEYHTIIIRLPKEKWSGQINKIRFDMLDSGAVGDEIFVKRIRLLNYPDLKAENDLSVENSDRYISSPSRTSVAYSEKECAVMFKVINNNDVGVQLDYSRSDLSADDYTTLEITYMMPTTNSKTKYTSEFFLCAGEDSNFAQGRSTTANITADGEYHTVTITLEGKNGWSGDLKKIRFDYFSSCAVGDVIYIKSINLK